MSKRKRGGANTPTDPSKSALPAVGDPTQATPDAAAITKPASRKAAAKPTQPAAPQGKPIKIADLRVPPLPQFETKPAAPSHGGPGAQARAATITKSGAPPASARASTGPSTRPPARKSEPPSASEPPPQAKVVEPRPVRVESVEPPGVGAAREPASDTASAMLDAPAEAPRAPTDTLGPHTEEPLTATVAPPGKRARLVEQGPTAEPPADSQPEPALAPTNLDEHAEASGPSAHEPLFARAPEGALRRAEGDAPRDGALVDSAAATLAANTQPVAPTLLLAHGRFPVNGTVFDGASDDDIWTEGLENTASAASALPADKAVQEPDDAGSHAPAARLARGSSGDRAREAAAFGSSQSLLSTDYYFRQYGAHGLRSMAAEVDDFGFDPHVDAKVRPLLETLCRRYFRVELEGAAQVPEHGRALLVANRSGALPWDGLVLRTALRSARPSLSALRWLAEDSVIHYPFMGVFMNRLGAVRACPENAERLLTQDRLVAVFPEGAQGSRKLFRDRYRLQRFGRGGYVKLALKLGIPILPTAIIGAEETNPVLGRSRLLGRFLGSDSVPITPTFPWLGLAGLLPAPVRWRIVVGAPIDLSAYGPDSAEDALVVHRLNEQIRSSLQTLVDQGKQQRGSALFR